MRVITRHYCYYQLFFGRLSFIRTYTRMHTHIVCTEIAEEIAPTRDDVAVKQ